MMFKRLRIKTKTVDEYDSDILNEGLRLALQWGEDWLQPIQGRLAKQYPRLSSEWLDKYNTACRAAMNYGLEKMYGLAESTDEKVDMNRFKEIMHSRYSWVNDDNMSHLYSQGMYYAWKDGFGPKG